MAQIPLITNRHALTPENFAITPPAAFGAGTAREVGRSAEVFQRIQDGYDAAESAKLIGEGSAGMAGVLTEAKTSISDPEEYKRFTDDRLEQVYTSTLEKASSPVVRRRLEAQLADNRANAVTQAQFGYFEKKKDRALGDLEITGDQMSKAAAAAPDENQRASIMRSYGALLGIMKASGYLSEQQLAAKSLAFEKTVLVNRANGLINRAPEEFLQEADQGTFDRLGEDVWKFRESARKKIEADETRNDKLTKKLAEVTEQDWFTRLSKDQLTDAEIQEAIDGKNPYVKPEVALRFKLDKDSAKYLTSGDSTGIRAIMEDYHSGSSTFGRIRQARAQINALRKNGNYSPLIDKALNELQTDERTMEGIEASRVNRAVNAAQESFDANVPATGIPFLDKMRAQQKAKVGEAVRKGEDPAPLIKGKQTEHKARFDQIPDAQKKVMDLAK